ncbi:MAG: Txe/YoeB family addiction module toxin [Desulfobacteraceae bacterium]|nr:Txe/YoeB family addiction module toxin [Desulfobacteraceae bacterium]MBU4002890.1 Txe/YoeB family addiction module toxin [Pseudomonadota bacterium]MBU4056135.1 Txe/YoeB family addiction module toxin [Pseudomonadota bacterium]
MRLGLSKRAKKLSVTKKLRESVFQPEFREDLRYWVEIDRKTALRIFQLIDAIMIDPFQGIGKPEPLKFLGSGVWSRRITQEHRLVYVVHHDKVDFVQARYHY